jgi:glycosyltransferase involved in cell wall biosynthesis
MNKRYVYLARWANGKSSGVIRKIDNTVAALNEISGVSASAMVINGHGFRAELDVLVQMLRCSCDVLVLRARPFFMLLYFPLLMVKRMQGKKIIIDVPTPLVAVKREVMSSSHGMLRKILSVAALYISNPIGLWPANRVLQYSDESPYFSFGLASKLHHTANGIQVDNYPMAPGNHGGRFTLIMVANLSFWHGCDRIIDSVIDYNAGHDERVSLIVVGDGDAKEELAHRVASKGSLVEASDIVFLGSLSGTSLDDAYTKAHVGVCSLGLYRIGLNRAAVLKAREYAARGLPFILANEDPDFGDDCRFIFKVDNDATSIGIIELLQWYNNSAAKISPEEIRSYAKRRLDFRVKVAADFLLE